VAQHADVSSHYFIRIGNENRDSQAEIEEKLTVFPQAFLSHSEEQKSTSLVLYEKYNEDNQENCTTFKIPRHVGISMYGYPPLRNRNISYGTSWTNSDIRFDGELDPVRLQPRCVEKVVKLCDRAVKHNYIAGGIIKLPPGYGKTVIALNITSRIRVKTLFIVHRRHLLEQICDRARRFLPNASVGKIIQDVFEIDNDIVVASIHSLIKREYQNDLDSFGLVFIDEAHHIAARTFCKVFDHLKAAFIFGLTATPTRADGLTQVVHWFLGPIVFQIDAECEKQVQHSRNITVHIVEVHYKWRETKLKFYNATKEKPSLFQLNRAYKWIMWETRRNCSILKTLRCLINKGYRKCLVLSKRIDHLHLLKNFCVKQKWKESISFCTSRENKKDRECAFDADVVFSTYEMCKEGIDLPHVQVLVLAMPAGNMVQVLGRLERGHGHKVVIDVIDDGLMHQFEQMHFYRKRIYQKKQWS